MRLVKLVDFPVGLIPRLLEDSVTHVTLKHHPSTTRRSLLSQPGAGVGVATKDLSCLENRQMRKLGHETTSKIVTYGILWHMFVALSLFEKYAKKYTDRDNRSRTNVRRIYPATAGASRAQYSKTFEECALHAIGFFHGMSWLCHSGFYTLWLVNLVVLPSSVQWAHQESSSPAPTGQMLHNEKNVNDENLRKNDAQRPGKN